MSLVFFDHVSWTNRSDFTNILFIAYFLSNMATVKKVERETAYFSHEGTYHLNKITSAKAAEIGHLTPQSFVAGLRDDAADLIDDIKTECTPTQSPSQVGSQISGFLANFIHQPFLPAFHSPGWLLRYIVGPYNREWFDGITSDIIAGLTVGLLMIPQALSYAGLANMPQVNGLYAAILPSAFYTFFGSSLQLAVGPVALASLLTGQLVIQYNAVPGSQNAVNVGAQAAMSVGFLLILFSAFNLGNMIHYVSRPVMSGFTTGAALIIGMSQLKVLELAIAVVVIYIYIYMYF